MRKYWGYPNCACDRTHDHHSLLMTWCFQTGLQLPKGQVSYVEKWPLINPNEIAFVLMTYLLFILKIGPILMKCRPPFQIRKFLIFYNLFKVINSAHLTYQFWVYIRNKGLFPRKCEHGENAIFIICMLYWKYLVTKIIDLFDTVLFVLRKKDSQITFLHVYHHIFMVIITWSTLRYDPSDHWAFMALFNCTVHTTMYVYYLVAALGPSFAKYLWWKKYLTIMQIVQFAAIMVHITIQTQTTQCPINTATFYVCAANLLFFICLFGDFYEKRYRATRAQITTKAQSPAGFACLHQE